MLRFIFASHHRVATGLKDTVDFLTQTDEKLYDISAYVTDDFDLEKEVKKLFAEFDADDTVVIMTDIMSGSVNQRFYPYLGENVFLVTGINVPLAVELVLTSEDQMSDAYIRKTIEAAKNSIVYVNAWNAEDEDSDE